MSAGDRPAACLEALSDYLSVARMLADGWPAASLELMISRVQMKSQHTSIQEALSDCLSVVRSPATALAPPAPMVWLIRQHHQHPHSVQRSVGQHAPSLATSPAGRRLHASRNHPALRAHPKPTTPAAKVVATNIRTLRSATLGSTLPRWPHLQRVDGLAPAETTPPCVHPQPTTPAARSLRACGLAARAICRPWPLREPKCL